MYCTHKCSSPHPGRRQAGWWADCQTKRRLARLSPGMGALSWGHFAWQKKPLLWSLPAGGCVSKWPAPPFRAAHRNTRGRLSFPSRLSGCGRLWLVLEAKEKEIITDVGGKEEHGSWGQINWTAYSQYRQAAEEKQGSGSCNSCLRLWKLSFAFLTAPQIFC